MDSVPAEHSVLVVVSVPIQVTALLQELAPVVVAMVLSVEEVVEVVEVVVELLGPQLLPRVK
jgi:hypothetical protein